MFETLQIELPTVEVTFEETKNRSVRLGRAKYSFTYILKIRDAYNMSLSVCTRVPLSQS